MALLSIILPVYNVAGYLRQSLDSIFRQPEAKDCEVILVNDGSTDSSLQIAREYEEKYVNVQIFDKKNEGVSATRNLGLDVATGEYVFFMDSDDLLHPGALRIILEGLKEYNPDILIWQYATFYSKPIFVRGLTKDLPVRLGGSSQAAFNRLMESGFAVSLGTKAFRRELLREKIRFNKDMTFGEDMFFCWKVFLLARDIFYIESPLYFYRQTGCSAVSRFHPELFEKYKNAFEEILDFASENGKMTEELSQDIDYHFACRLQSLSAMEEKAPYSDVEKETHLSMIIRDVRIQRALVNDSRLSGMIYSLARKGEIRKILANAKKTRIKSKLLLPLKKLLK